MSTTSFGSCPNGGSWYTCIQQSPTFFGCCTSDPCNGKGCPASDLRAAGMGEGSGFDGDTYANDSSYYPNIICDTGKWYTCAAGSPSFQGCCDGVNPCSTGSCPQDSLYPASFSFVDSVMDPSVECSYGKWYSCLSQSTPFQGCCLSNPCTGDGGTCDSSQSYPVIPGPISRSVGISHLGGSPTSMPAGSKSTMTSSPAVSTMGDSTTVIPAGSEITSTSTSTSIGGLPSATSSSKSSPNIALIAGSAAGGAIVGILIILVIAFFVRKCYKKRQASGHITPIATTNYPSGPSELYSPETTTRTAYTDAQHSKQSTYGDYSSKNPGYASPDPERNLSPGPPMYESPQRTPNRNTFLSEIDSVDIYGAGGDRSPNLAQNRLQRNSRDATGHGLGMVLSDVAELPGHSR